MDSDSGPSNLKRKLGIRKPSSYKSNIIKTARVKGLGYTNWKGTDVPPVLPGTNNDCNCRLKCYSLINKEEREDIFRLFRELETKNEQDIYLQSLISISDVKSHRRKKKSEESSKPRRDINFNYGINLPCRHVRICKIAFINLHGITPARLRRLSTFLAVGKLPIDLRGKSTPGNTIPDHVVDLIHKHILSFPTEIAHYPDKDVHYLSEKLDIKVMHDMFLKIHPDLNVKYSYYRKVFKENFNYSFGKPDTQ